jgi:serine/threonine protein kinase
MEWVDAPSLRRFIGAHRHQRQTLAAAAENFLAMTRVLHRHRIAHGDLQSDNLKVQMNGNGPQLVLIDYDTLFVPGLENSPVTNTGLPAYQHPARESSRLASEKDDYFSELVIYTTLHALAEDPKLWDDYRMDLREKELLFSGDDLASPSPSPLFHRLRKLSPNVNKLTLLLWNFLQCRDIQRLLPLDESVGICLGDGAAALGSGFEAMLKGSLARCASPWMVEWTGKGSAPPCDPPPPTRDPHAAANIFRPGASPGSAAPSEPPPQQNMAGSTFEALLRGRQASTGATGSPTVSSPPLTPSPAQKPESDWAQVVRILCIIAIVIFAIIMLATLLKF